MDACVTTIATSITTTTIFSTTFITFISSTPTEEVEEGMEEVGGDPDRLASLNFPLKRNKVEDNEEETIDTHLLVRRKEGDILHI